MLENMHKGVRHAGKVPEEFARIGGRFLGPELQSASQLAQQTAWTRAAFPAGEPA